MKPEFSIGVDLGGTQLRAALVDPDGAVLAARRVRTDRAGGPRGVTAQIHALVDAIRTQDVATIGIGIPGAFDAKAGTVLGIPALPGWTDVPLVDLVSRETGLACVLENDATAAANGEWRAGAGKGCDHFVYLTISTGIGSGVVVDGRILRGAGGLAGEIGHTKITDASDPCSCGQIGCWEAVASGTALGRQAQRLAIAEPHGLVAREAGEEPAAAYHVGAAARLGDPSALRLLREEAVWLGAGFVNAQHLYAPERIVVGGGLSLLLDLMIDDITAAIRKRLLPGFRPADIVAAQLGDDAGMVGAALHALSSRK